MARPGIEPRTTTYESGALPIALRGPALLGSEEDFKNTNMTHNITSKDQIFQASLSFTDYNF